MTKFNKTDPIYIQIAYNLMSKILKKELELGSKLNNVRSLAKEYVVTPRTIQNATNYLMDFEVLEKTQGSKILITKDNDIIENCKNEIINKIRMEYREKLISLGIEIKDGDEYV